MTSNTGGPYSAARKLITDQLDETRANQLIDTAIAELPNKVH